MWKSSGNGMNKFNLINFHSFVRQWDESIWLNIKCISPVSSKRRGGGVLQLTAVAGSLDRMLMWSSSLDAFLFFLWVKYWSPAKQCMWTLSTGQVQIDVSFPVCNNYVLSHCTSTCAVLVLMSHGPAWPHLIQSCGTALSLPPYQCPYRLIKNPRLLV